MTTKIKLTTAAFVVLMLPCATVSALWELASIAHAPRYWLDPIYSAARLIAMPQAFGLVMTLVSVLLTHSWHSVQFQCCRILCVCGIVIGGAQMFIAHHYGGADAPRTAAVWLSHSNCGLLGLILQGAILLWTHTFVSDILQSRADRPDS